MVVLMLFVQTALAQERVISGIVTSDEDGSPMPGVNVIVKGTTTGTVTDVSGAYKLSLAEGRTILTFSFIGFQTQEVEVGARSVIDVTMEPDVSQLQELVVVGYGTQSKRLTTQNVSDVSAKNFANMPVLSPQEALQGQAAGVQMVGTSGVIGSAATVRVRGVASLNNANPLYVVDGVPLNNENRSDGLGGASLNPIAEINPADIESISVLKDAAAVAIYGSRGANGVILIKTKSGGKNQETQFNVDYYTGWSNPTYTRTMMNADQYRQYAADIATADGTPTDPNDPNEFPQTSFDWPAAVLQTGKVNNYSLSANGGNEKTAFYVGGTYFNQDSYTIGNAADKINARINLTHDARENLRFGVNLGITRLQYDRINADNSTFAPLTSAYLQLPWVMPRDENGSYVNTGFVANVLAIEDLSDYTTISRRTTGNFFTEWDILPSLTFKSDFGIDLVQLEQFYRDPDIVSPGGYGYKSIDQDNKWLSTNTLNYSKDFGEHTVSALAGYSFETSVYSSIEVEGSGFVSDDLPNVNSAATKSITNAEGSQWALLSYFTRLNYSFRNKYLFEVSARRDGSSRFGADKRFGNFYAVSGGWILSEESFLKDVSFVNFLKLSTSYGIAGNDQIGRFGSLGLYQGGVTADYAGLPGLTPNQPANPLLSWEETKQFDVSLDFTTLKNRLDISASYYLKNTDGILLAVPLPYTTGFSSRNQNVGALRNKGVDLMLTSKNIQSADFNWETSFNVGFLNQEVTKLPDDNVDLDGNPFIAGTSSQRVVQGHTSNEFFLIRYKGINPDTGEAEWLTKDGEVTTTPTANDRVFAGSAIPKFTGSLRSTMTYKGFDFTFMLNFVNGNKVYLDDMRFTDNPNNVGGFNLHSRLLNYWKQPGDNAYAPALDASTFGTFAQRSTQQLFDGSYLRLRNVTIGYTLPKSVLDRTFLTRARVYAMGTNFLTFSKLTDWQVDPEINGGGTDPRDQGESFFTSPQSKTITVGVNIGF
jgi:TonB-dependent starch-binding outer membrane protein SusC